MTSALAATAALSASSRLPTAEARPPSVVHDLADITPGTPVRVAWCGREVEGVVAGPVRRICDGRGQGARSLPVRVGGATLGVTSADLITPEIRPKGTAGRKPAAPGQGKLL